MLVERTLRDVMDKFGVSEQDLFVMGPYEGKRWSEKKKAWEDVSCKEALFYYVREDEQYQSILKNGIVPNGSSKMKLSKKLVYLGNTPVSAVDTMTIELRKGEKS